MLLVLGLIGFFSIYWIFQTRALEGLLMLYQFHYQKEKDIWKGILQTIMTMAWVGYMFLYQKMAKNLVIKNKCEYDVHYLLGSRLYKIRIYSSRGPARRKVLQVIDQNDNDVTTELMSYLGPREDFHGILYRPEHFNYDQLTFNLANGDTKVFSRQEPIMVNDFFLHEETLQKK